MKIIINPKYEHLRPWLTNLPQKFEKGGTTIHAKRNVIKTFTLPDCPTLNVKRYRIPPLINRFIYTFFRTKKAYKAYHNALQVLEKGFDTPESVAYIEIYRSGLLAHSYFISLQSLNKTEIREYYFGPLDGNEALIDSFARYSAQLHDAGIYHLDYSPGNILIEKVNGIYTFTLIDINRMKFRKITNKEGCKNFSRLFEDDEIYKRIAITYSQERKKPFNEDQSIQMILYYKNRFLQKKELKKNLKALFGKE